MTGEEEWYSLSGRAKMTSMSGLIIAQSRSIHSRKAFYKYPHTSRPKIHVLPPPPPTGWFHSWTKHYRPKQQITTPNGKFSRVSPSTQSIHRLPESQGYFWQCWSKLNGWSCVSSSPTVHRHQLRAASELTVWRFRTNRSSEIMYGIPDLFKCLTDYLMNKFNERLQGIYLSNCRLTDLRFTDDIFLFASDLISLIEPLEISTKPRKLDLASITARLK